MPQYEVGHIELVARLRRALPAGVEVVGQAYDGVGVPDCVRAANEVCERLLAETTSDEPSDHEETVP
jgi:oxygen-dependent protoporphyrinogen oxidase